MPSVSKKHFIALNCVELKNGERYLLDDTSVNCDSDDYKNFLYILGILIAIYQSLPLFYISLLYPIRDRLNPNIDDERKKLEHRDHDKSLESVSFLFKDYVCHAWWFEIAE